MKKSCYATLLLLLLLALSFAVPARADEAEIERRFHDAYVLEVVEGKIADAARVYLALMGEAEVPLRLKSESRFRFAICAVLLGRADEGRAHLQALIEDEEAPAALRKRARTYLDSVASLGIGTEIEKKLQALVFDLGRIGPSTVQIPAYRDFEIIGKRSLPFLRELLEHSDPMLRRHAFRLLVRMGEPGMSDRWKPEMGHRTGREFITYLGKRGPERRNFEKRVMEIGKPAWQVVRYMSTGPIFSLAFARAFAATKIAPGTAVAYMGYQLRDEAFDQLVEWMDGEDVALADAATDWLLRQGFAHEKADGAFYSKMFRRLMTRLADEKTRISQEGIQRFQLLTARMPVKTTLDTLQSVLEDVENHGGVLQGRRAAKVLLEPIAAAFDEQEVTAEQADRYAVLLLRWLTVVGRSDEAFKTTGNRGGSYLPSEALARHLGHVCRLLEEPRAHGIILRIFAVPGRINHVHWAAALPPATDPRGVRLIASAIAAAPQSGGRSDAFDRLNVVSATPPSPALMEAFDTARLSLMDELSEEELARFFANYYSFVRQRPTEQVQGQLLMLLAKARTLPGRERKVILQRLLAGSVEYFENVLAPLAQARWGELDELERRRMLSQARSFLSSRPRNGQERERLWDVAADVLRPHLAEINPASLYNLNQHRKRFPLESWIPLLPDEHTQWLRGQLGTLSTEEGNEVAERMVANPENINHMVLTFLSRYGSPELQKTVFDQLLKSKDPERRDLALTVLETGGKLASPEALEVYLALELAATPVDVDRLHRAGQLLLKQRPSEKLFPVARVLLGSDNRYRVLSGISMANSLGRDDLVPFLMPHLRSMDSSVRVAAKKAVAAIRAISDLQQHEPGAKK